MHKIRKEHRSKVVKYANYNEKNNEMSKQEQMVRDKAKDFDFFLKTSGDSESTPPAHFRNTLQSNSESKDDSPSAKWK